MNASGFQLPDLDDDLLGGKEVEVENDPTFEVEFEDEEEAFTFTEVEENDDEVEPFDFDAVETPVKRGRATDEEDSEGEDRLPEEGELDRKGNRSTKGFKGKGGKGSNIKGVIPFFHPIRFLRRIYGWYKRLSLALLNGFAFPFRLIRAIPYIGRVASPVLWVVNVLKQVVYLTPLIFFALIGFLLYGWLASPTSVNLPDEGSAKVVNLTVEGEVARMTVVNSGEVEVEVLPTVTRHQIFTGLKFWPQPTGDCQPTEPTLIPVDGEVELSFPCPLDGGFHTVELQ